MYLKEYIMYLLSRKKKSTAPFHHAEDQINRIDVVSKI